MKNTTTDVRYLSAPDNIPYLVEFLQHRAQAVDDSREAITAQLHNALGSLLQYLIISRSPELVLEPEGELLVGMSCVHHVILKTPSN